MGSVGGLDQCAACPVDSKCLANFEELVEVGSLASFPGHVRLEWGLIGQLSLASFHTMHLGMGPRG